MNIPLGSKVATSKNFILLTQGLDVGYNLMLSVNKATPMHFCSGMTQFQEVVIKSWLPYMNSLFTLSDIPIINERGSS